MNIRWIHYANAAKWSLCCASVDVDSVRDKVGGLQHVSAVVEDVEEGLVSEIILIAALSFF